MIYLAAITVLGRIRRWQKSTLDPAQPEHEKSTLDPAQPEHEKSTLEPNLNIRNLL